MNTTIDQLSEWAEMADNTARKIAHMEQHLSRSEFNQAARAADQARSLAVRLRCALERAGAIPPPDRPQPESTPLHLLCTPASRRLADALLAAAEAAQDVDAERGEDGWGDVLADMAAAVNEEVYGPSGRGEGARE